jgi:hypothetical protein
MRRREMAMPSPSEIVQRLAHAHEDDVGEPAVFLGRRPFAEVVAGHLHLGHDLGGGQVADQGLGAGVAEGAVERATHLARHTERAGAADVGDVDALDLNAGRRADQPLTRTVLGDLPLDDLRPIEGEGLGQGRAHLLGHVAHGGEVGDAVVVDPPPELGGPHPRLLRAHDLGRDQDLRELSAGQPRKVGLRSPWGRRAGRAWRARKVEGHTQGENILSGRSGYRRRRSWRQMDRPLRGGRPQALR